MNIQTQCCGIILLIVLFQFYVRHQKVDLNTGKVFEKIFLLTFCSIVLDALSIVAIANMDVLPHLLVEFSCKIYLISLVAVVFCSLLYICADIYIKENIQYKKHIHIFLPLSLIEGIIILFSPIQMYYEPDTGIAYTYDQAVLLTYIFIFTFMLLNIYLIFHTKKRIKSTRREVVLIWMLVWILAATIQFFNNEILITGFASAIGVLIIYLKIENPEDNLEKQTGFFNQNAFIEYTRQVLGKPSEDSLLWLHFDRVHHYHLQLKIEKIVDLEISEYFKAFCDTTIFKISEDELVLLLHNQECVDSLISDIKTRFEKSWGREAEVYLYPKGLYLSDISKLKDYKDLFYMFNYIRSSGNNFEEDNILMVNDNLLQSIYHEQYMEQMILAAIENDRIEVYYQPIYSTKEKKFTCAEALMRIRDAEGNIIPPDSFISLAEKNGMIIKLGEIVFEKVCRFIKENGLICYGMKYIEVNLSVVQCNYVHLAEDLIQIMEKYELNPEYISFEITETASLSVKRILLDNMRCLMNYGTSFALDDFGTGQSNLNYIVEMPVDIVKFDRMMTNAYFENSKVKHVMDAAIQMIRGMNLKIVSEGVETKKQYEVMEKMGIHYIQGFYFSKPLPKKEFLNFLEEKAVE